MSTTVGGVNGGDDDTGKTVGTVYDENKEIFFFASMFLSSHVY